MLDLATKRFTSFSPVKLALTACFIEEGGSKFLK